MAIIINMPEVAANATYAVLLEWHKKPGEIIAAGDCLADIETDKASVELIADDSGVLGVLLADPGQTVATGAPVCVLLSRADEEVDVPRLIAGAGVPVEAPALHDDAPPREDSLEPVNRIFASPAARKLAREGEIPLSSIKGSGPNGRIVKRDVEPYMAEAAIEPENGFVDLPHSPMRRTIARRLVESKSTIPHFYLEVDCRVDKLLALRRKINKLVPRKVSVNDFVVRAAALALKQTPAMNVAWMDDAMRQYRQVDIAIAVATESGLITPIVRGAEGKSVAGISAEIADLALRARASQLRPDEYQGGSFTVTNLGMYGVLGFAAIINPPQAAILAVGAAKPMPVAKGRKVKVATIMRCTLSVDHRAIDGALAAGWLQAFSRLIESPLLLLV